MIDDELETLILARVHFTYVNYTNIPVQQEFRVTFISVMKIRIFR
jgi:hypothetical protein